MNCNNCKYKEHTLFCCVKQIKSELKNVLKNISWLKEDIVDEECDLYESNEVNNEQKDNM